MSMSQTSPEGGRVVVITGAGQGLGRAYALMFGARNQVVVAMDLNEVAVNAVASEIRAAGGECLSLVVDVGNADAVEDAARRIEKQYGRADILVNNAAIFSTIQMRPFEEIPLDEWSRVLHVNVTGPFLMARSIAPLMRRKKWGRIINVSSAAALMGRANYLHYTTSKAAVIGMTRSMARELGPDGITVNAVLPGATDTEIPRQTVTPAQKQAQIAMRCIQREANVDDLTGTVAFLASDESRFISGQSFVVDGGLVFL
ncbi:MAG: SDR family oxidoreductase [Burkholderiales bacterium]|nr:SDR family oxidoreductase [Burkholderiales bacterium]